jgi:hypothetical protein
VSVEALFSFAPQRMRQTVCRKSPLHAILRPYRSTVNIALAIKINKNQHCLYAINETLVITLEEVFENDLSSWTG